MPTHQAISKCYTFNIFMLLYDFRAQTLICYLFIHICCIGCSCCIYYLCRFTLFWGPIRFPYKMMFMLFKNSSTGVTSRARSVYHSIAPAFNSVGGGGLLCSICSFSEMFCRSLFVVCFPNFLFGHCIA